MSKKQNNFTELDIPMIIDGMGIVFCSEIIACSIENGSDFFNSDFALPEKVAMHVKCGDVTGFCTGSSGKYILKVREGYPDNSIRKDFPKTIRLCINVQGNAIQIRDLFDLLEWEQSCLPSQKIYIDDGYYHITLCTARPKSGIVGDNQIIFIYLNKLESMPELSYTGVPQLIP